MRWLVIYLWTVLGLFIPVDEMSKITSYVIVSQTIEDSSDQNITPMEALDMVKEHYAGNFIKIYSENTKDQYYYKLPFAEYYLVLEDESSAIKEYTIHLYEFVVDDTNEGIGHTVTYGWFTVDRKSGAIIKQSE